MFGRGDSVRVLVTGGSGHIGKYVVADLVDHGYEVVSVDRRPLTREQIQGQPGVRFREADTTNVGHMAGAMADCDAVIHLGAIPAPNLHPDEVVRCRVPEVDDGVGHDGADVDQPGGAGRIRDRWNRLLRRCLGDPLCAPEKTADDEQIRNDLPHSLSSFLRLG